MELQPQLSVGQRVRDVDQEDDHYGYIVTESPFEAGEHVIDGLDETVAEFNDCDEDEAVYGVVFGDRLLSDLDDSRVYSYPQSRLEPAPITDESIHALEKAVSLVQAAESDLQPEYHEAKLDALHTALHTIQGVVSRLSGSE
jgi:hypothetical protein